MIIFYVVRYLFVSIWFITIPAIFLVALAYFGPEILRAIRARLYFASEPFVRQRSALQQVVEEHNQIAGYLDELRRSERLTLGTSAAGSQSHLASFENRSAFNYQRDRNVSSGSASNVHTCSLQTVRNASNDPLKYLSKYFNIKPEESRLTQVEALGAEVARLEGAVRNLSEREESLLASFDPPRFIVEHYWDRFMAKVGVRLNSVEIPYPEYIFEYVSAGGNSSQVARIILDTETIDHLVFFLAEKIRFKRSAAGQRALMTARLRSEIKQRDNFTCQGCGVSVMVEPHLLLEVDHIIPVSRGGLSVRENLQTLCWRCNRTKSNRLPA
ncbi:HNH endonuclease [Williamsia serinedens]|uniref:HNH endonuclease n=1 Tax=Williamsia serinedens TaxID=391736 RepID=UPI0020A3B565|nr:HNH endonuclease signature motif containing protein [Williamsia serinedens]